jgi:arabinofuranosyltransferase
MSQPACAAGPEPAGSNRPEGTPASASPGGEWHRASAALLAVFPALLLVTMGWRRRWVSEDAFIDFRVIENLVAGHGPVFNLAERVEAYTNPLWVALLALVHGGGLPLSQSAVWLGLGFTAAGLVAAQAGARRLDEPIPDRRGGMSLPLGALVYAALPPSWDFATSGLETGVAIAWLGLAFWLLTRTLAGDAPDRTAVILGLGPLLRPDLTIFTVTFLAVVLTAPRFWSRGWRSVWSGRARGLAAGLALPAAYQLFRMGYFGALVPNTALAKEADAAYWSQGSRYVLDFVGTYHLWLPLVLLAPWYAGCLLRAWRRNDSGVVALLLAPVLAATVHTLYVAHVGGDFMHGRLLLPSLFGLLLPVATVRLAGWPYFHVRAVSVAAVGVVLAWAVACALWLRVSYPNQIGPEMIADERGFSGAFSGQRNPVDAADYADTDWGRRGLFLRGWVSDGRGNASAPPPHPRLVLTRLGVVPLDPDVRPDVGVVAVARNIGIQGYLAGPAVHLVDRQGLADPLASRLRLAARGRPGHEKELPEAWVVARFGDPADARAATPEVAAARVALGCGALGRLLLAVTDPMTPRRFVANTLLAFQFHRLRVPPDPTEARAVLCESAAGASERLPEAPGPSHGHASARTPFVARLAPLARSSVRCAATRGTGSRIPRAAGPWRR